MNPFARYLPRLYCPDQKGFVNLGHSCDQDYLSLEALSHPPVKIEYRAEVKGMVANTNSLSQVLYDVTDLLWWEKKKQEGNISDEDVAHGIVGVMGERMLSLMLGYLLNSVTLSLDMNCSSGVLREKGKHRGKGYIARFNNDYLLRFKGLSNFVILKKDHDALEEASYQQERFGMVSTEIDGLGYLHLGEEKYLLVGESSLNRYFLIHSWDKQRHSNESIEERIFQPLQSLFPHHYLIYLVMGPPNSLFDSGVNPVKIKAGPQKVYETLQKMGIDTLFLSMPEIHPGLSEIAAQIVAGKLLSFPK